MTDLIPFAKQRAIGFGVTREMRARAQQATPLPKCGAALRSSGKTSPAPITVKGVPSPQKQSGVESRLCRNPRSGPPHSKNATADSSHGQSVAGSE